MTGGDLVAEVLEKHGVKFLFTPCRAHISPILLAAKQGDQQEYERLMQEFDEEVGIDSTFLGTQLYAWGGLREDANRLAAQYDADPWGPWVLWQIANWCACDNAFDLEVTPNFARMINDSDVDWPPRSGRDYPLKDW